MDSQRSGEAARSLLEPQVQISVLEQAPPTLPDAEAPEGQPRQSALIRLPSYPPHRGRQCAPVDGNRDRWQPPQFRFAPLRLGM